MIQLGPQHYLVEKASELPNPRLGRPAYVDAETRSADDSLRSNAFYPYLGDRACMWGLCFDEGPAWAVPIRMRDGRCNIDPAVATRWLGDVLAAASEWRNCNPKFDAHVARQDGLEYEGKIACITTKAKLVDSDRWSHDLKDLMREWCGRSISAEDRVKAFLEGYKLPRGARAKCYGLVPTDILAYYNCEDVLGTRELDAYCEERMPVEVKPTWEMEQQLTPVLFDMERLGLRTDERQLKVAKLLSMNEQIRLSTLIAQMTGEEFTDSIKFTFPLFCGKWGLPVLSRDKKSGNPSFDADALKLYAVHPEVVSDPHKLTVTKAIMAYRKEDTFLSLFVNSFLENRDARGYVHTSYNQVVRTGRMSARDPNSQQFDERAKQLIWSDGDGFEFAEYDYSQIEFRFIAHYMKDEKVIQAYLNDPRTNFHRWVSTLSGLDYDPAKTMNFSMAFGAGKKNTIGQLAADPKVIAEVSKEIDDLIAAGALEDRDRLKEFGRRTWQRGTTLYAAYHDALPAMKPTAEQASTNCRKRGYVFNVYGRRRHLPAKAAHVSFNTVCQGGAGDLVKRRIIATSPRHWPELKAAGLTQRASVHDSILVHGRLPDLERMHASIMERLEAPEPRLRVPIACNRELTGPRWNSK